MAEADETTETTDTLPEHIAATPEVETPAEPEAEASPPDVGEALSQLSEKFSALESRLPEPESEEQPDVLESLVGDYDDDDGEEDPESAEEGEGDEDYIAELRNMMREEATNAFLPYVQQQEAQRREQAISALAEQHPRLREPEVLEEVASRVEQLAERYGNPMLRTDPDLVRQTYMAYEAEAAASADTPAEAASPGATLETGAGPGAPEPEVDPAQKAYELAINGMKPTDVFSQ